ncbi:tRNA (guanine-N(7)-)-methyltransferase non-catalytic subunit trm82 [Yamadazyma tenuis]|uniref:Uncharacterized protein n=1 Tax=Candida tenuis (strain ATCC 10573 / BCRC 21748 / CBS 615 / JCM 9827 / NBRC 10315 / NRRL Y-1498 / VKM Y-70) TaxID=590646 RepID=G3BCM8_CANTC|nr:uncharacterized protein CANTEDRAFT_116259 [Yamadazyma tenuis ATCC 10573]EGV60204.1 hypothetical protein CANTEDRAFT_116259 [Yamadazyma tenuis ATCC 10573]WEJ94556.1 tRNA (guanine-N(7)-)-methyltransferase non-catalytic subunit trm82 [Yamadazyma tenuis]
MKHPFQNIEATSTHLFATVKNSLQVFSLNDGILVGEWLDTVDSQQNLVKQHQAKFEQLQKQEDIKSSSEEPETKRAESNSKTKIPKFPTPGPGAPPIYNYIRCLELTSDEKYLIGTTDSDKSIIIFELDFNSANCLKLVKRQVFPKRPCSISVADNNTTAVVGDKFGDVYKIPIDCEPPIDEKLLKPILGHVSMLTDVLVGENEGRQYILTSDRDEHIKVSHYPQTFVVKHWLFGHDEFISSMIFPSFDKTLLVTGGGDDSIYLWDWIHNKALASFNLRSLVEAYLNESHYPPERFRTETSVKEICVVKIVSSGRKIFVLLENVTCVLYFTINEDLTFSIDKVLDVPHPLVDLTISENQLIGASDSENILTFINIDPFEVVHNEISSKIAVLNPCDVSSRDDFYPLYAMNNLRKRSEH